MAPVAVILNLRADALTAACSGDYQRETHDWYQSSPLPVTNWGYSCPSCAAPHGQNQLPS